MRMSFVNGLKIYNGNPGDRKGEKYTYKEMLKKHYIQYVKECA
jgi:hypothetical protein